MWDGVATDLKVISDGTNWDLYWKGVLRKTIPLSYTSCSWQPASAAYFTETWNFGDSLGGTASAPYLMRHMEYWTTVGGSSHFVNTSSCNINDGQSSIYHCTASGNQANTWTAR